MERVIPPSPTRTGADRCPGLLRPHLAVDGAVVRVRLPGGMVTAGALAQLGAAAADFANGEIQLTSRANLQLRGVPVDASGDVPDALVDAVRVAGLLPSETAELVRNILCSPMTGRLGGFADLRPLAGRLDAALCGSPALAALPGRFLFGLDDGSGDIAVAGCDLGVVATPDGRAVLIAGGQRGPVVELTAAVDALVTMALTFLELRRNGALDCWHVAELPGGGAALLTAAADGTGVGQRSATAATAIEAAAPPRYGAYPQRDGRSMLSLVVPLGRLTSAQVRAVVAAARLGSGDLVITPWNGLVVPDLSPAVGSPELAAVAAMLAGAGLPSTADSGWIGVSACTGAPACARGAGPTAPVATRIAHLAGTAAAAGQRSGAEPVHVVACERRCGAPAVAHREVMIELTGHVSRLRPARTDDGRTTRRRTAPSTGMSTAMSTAASESA